jgi:hypothetical protein
LIVPGESNDTVEGTPNVARNSLITFGSMIVCLDRAGSVAVTGITPIRSSGLSVSEFGLRPSPFWTNKGTGIGDARGGLQKNHFTENHLATLVCSSRTGRGYELAVALRKLTNSPASLTGFKIAYTSDGHVGSVTFPLGILLCPAQLQSAGVSPEPKCDTDAKGS